MLPKEVSSQLIQWMIFLLPTRKERSKGNKTPTHTHTLPGQLGLRAETQQVDVGRVKTAVVLTKERNNNGLDRETVPETGLLSGSSHAPWSSAHHCDDEGSIIKESALPIGLHRKQQPESVCCLFYVVSELKAKLQWEGRGVRVIICRQFWRLRRLEEEGTHPFQLHSMRTSG